jgi:hypothetical protein
VSFRASYGSGIKQATTVADQPAVIRHHGPAHRAKEKIMALAQGVLTNVATPLLDAAEVLIPAGVALSGVHKLLTHQESGAGFLVEMLIKGGGAFLLIVMIKAIALHFF